MIWTPWIDLTPTEKLIFELGDRVLELPRFRIGDARTVTRRDKRANDLVMYQTNRPRPQSYLMEFGPYKKTGLYPPDWLYVQFKRLMRVYPGWVATITFPDETIMVGIVNDPTYQELSDCQMMIKFNFDILRDYPKGEVPV